MALVEKKTRIFSIHGIFLNRRGIILIQNRIFLNRCIFSIQNGIFSIQNRFFFNRSEQLAFYSPRFFSIPNLLCKNHPVAYLVQPCLSGRRCSFRQRTSRRPLSKHTDAPSQTRTQKQTQTQTQTQSQTQTQTQTQAHKPTSIQKHTDGNIFQLCMHLKCRIGEMSVPIAHTFQVCIWSLPDCHRRQESDAVPHKRHSEILQEGEGRLDLRAPPRCLEYCPHV